MMLNTLEEIERRLRAGEDARVGFKKVNLGSKGLQSPNTEAIAGETVAFANASGGAILLSMADQGIVQRLTDHQIKDVENWIINTAPLTTHQLSPYRLRNGSSAMMELKLIHYWY